VIQDAAFDARDPLANRPTRFWPWPFGNHRTGIPLANRIENETIAQEARTAAAREELRLFLCWFHRARDMLALITRNGQENAWLDLLQAPWLTPLEGVGTMIQGVLGPARVPYCTRTIQPPAAVARSVPAASYRWFPAPVTPTPKLPGSRSRLSLVCDQLRQ
jgi:hypothetical protein